MAAPRRSRKVFTGVLKKTEIEDLALGFDDAAYKIYCAHDGPDPKTEPSTNCKKLRIGIRIRNNHASVVIRELLDSETSGLTDEKRLITIPVNMLRDHRIISSNTLRQLHIRYEGDKMVLALDERNGDLFCDRYVEICDVFISWEKLQCLALSGCPKKHSLVIDDCATFTRDLVNSLLSYFLSQTEAQNYMESLRDYIIIVEDSVRAEASLRNAVEHESSAILRDL